MIAGAIISEAKIINDILFPLMVLMKRRTEMMQYKKIPSNTKFMMTPFVVFIISISFLNRWRSF